MANQEPMEAADTVHLKKKRRKETNLCFQTQCLELHILDFSSTFSVQNCYFL